MPSSTLPVSASLKVAEIAEVPDTNRQDFCDLFSGTVKSIWGRARAARPGPELLSAERAARCLHERRFRA